MRTWSVFDSFASSFDAKLTKLGYRAPELIAGALTENLGPQADWGTVADLGCGTGLVGMLLRQHARRLVGVDLSHEMLKRARRRGVYDDLTQANLVSFLQGKAGSFDVTVAADGLCHFGELGEVIAAAGGALRPGGVVVFTVESLPEGSDDWVLALTGRYAHSRRYLATEMAGFDDVVITACELRMEAGLGVPGFLVCARAPCHLPDSSSVRDASCAGARCPTNGRRCE